jgi:hypothetical protein
MSDQDIQIIRDIIVCYMGSFRNRAHNDTVTFLNCILKDSDPAGGHFSCDIISPSPLEGKLVVARDKKLPFGRE